MTYAEYKSIKANQNTLVDSLSSEINAFDTNEMGLVKDEIRNTTEYRTLKNTLNREFKKLQEINTFGTKNFKKEMALDRSQRYLKV